MNPTNERKELIKRLEKMEKEEGELCPICVADFILADRKRIVEPLVKHKKLWCGNWKEYTASDSIDETLKRAGVEL